MDSLLLIGCGLLVIGLLSFLVVYFVSESAKNSKRAEHAEKNLEIIKRFQTGMSRPLARGNDLIERFKRGMRKP